jgi:beta-glucanase (GH16 family)
MSKVKIGLLIIALVLFSAILTAPMSAAPTDPNWVQVWADECNGASGSAVDGSKWNLVNSGGGFGNNELQFYTNRTANSYYDGSGNLVIKTIKESYSGYNYTSAKLFSQNKGDWKYCRVQIRAKLPRGRCVWPAFWMMPTSSVYGGWPVSGEIDIMENRGDQMNKVGGTLHYGNPWQYKGASYTLSSGTFDAAYHTFDMEWEAGVFRWYVDGNLYQTRNHPEWYCSAANESTNPYAPFDQNFYLQLNTAVGGPGTPYTGNQNPDDSVFPQHMYIDYVRVFQRGTGGPTPTNTNTPSGGASTPTNTATATSGGTYSSLLAQTNNKYVCADNYGNNPLIANRTSISSWEQFQIINNGDGTVALLSRANNKYVCADLNQSTKLIARSTSVQQWEKFKMINQGGNVYAFQAMANNQYVCCDEYQGYVLYANRASVSSWEKFAVQ